MEDEWRLWQQRPWLQRAKIKYAVFHATERNDHEHCEFCWEKISEFPETQHAGYCTLDEHYWICETCFHDFKEMFEWTLVESAD